MTLHGALALIRLRAAPGAAPLAQTFTDQLFRGFNAGLREAWAGVLTVPKRMRKLAGAFHGRLEAYAAPIASADAAALAAALSRNMLGEESAAAASLAEYALSVARGQAEMPVQALLGPKGWPAPPA